jgi:hypothetical protein
MKASTPGTKDNTDSNCLCNELWQRIETLDIIISMHQDYQASSS